MWRDFTELFRYRDLIYLLVRRDLRLRYKNSFLGFFWSLLNPLLQVFIMTLIVKRFFGVPIPNYSAYLFCALIPWEYFSNTVLDCCYCILNHAALVRKVSFPREALPLGTTLGTTVHFVLSMGVVFIYFLILPVYLEPKALLIIPVAVCQFLLGLGIGFVVSALNVYFEDVRFIVAALFRILFFAVPVMYPVETVGTRLYDIYMLNPMASFIVAYQKLLLPPVQVDALREWTRHPDLVARPLDWHYLGIAMATSCLTFVIGFAIFHRMKWGVAERLSH